MLIDAEASQWNENELEIVSAPVSNGLVAVVHTVDAK
jgi:hypothetical protein